MAKKPTCEELRKRVKELEKELVKSRQAQKALRASEKKYRTFFDNANEAVFIADVKTGVILDASKGAERLLGRSRRKIIGMHQSQLHPADKVKYYTKKFRKHVRNNRTVDFEAAIEKKDGTTVPVCICTAVMEHQEKKVIQGVFCDITEHKRAEEALRQREATLKIRTNELGEANKALRALLKQRDKYKTELEEKVMLNVRELVLPYAEKLKRRRLDAKSMAYLSVLESNLNDIVSPFAHKLSSKHVGLTPSEIKIAHLIRDGRTTKEMAELLNVSRRTIESHRQNIRMKVGLHGKKANLRSHLLSI